MAPPTSDGTPNSLSGRLDHDPYGQWDTDEYGYDTSPTSSEGGPFEIEDMVVGDSARWERQRGAELFVVHNEPDAIIINFLRRCLFCGRSYRRANLMVSNHLRYRDPLDEFEELGTILTVDIGPEDCYDCIWNLSMKLASGINDEEGPRYMGHD